MKKRYTIVQLFVMTEQLQILLKTSMSRQRFILSLVLLFVSTFSITHLARNVIGKEGLEHKDKKRFGSGAYGGND